MPRAPRVCFTEETGCGFLRQMPSPVGKTTHSKNGWTFSDSGRTRVAMFRGRVGVPPAGGRVSRHPSRTRVSFATRGDVRRVSGGTPDTAGGTPTLPRNIAATGDRFILREGVLPILRDNLHRCFQNNPMESGLPQKLTFISPMNTTRLAILVTSVATLLASFPARAVSVFWDTNGATAGSSGGITANGTWDASAVGNWSVDANGLVGTSSYAVANGGAPAAADVFFPRGEMRRA